MLSFSRLIEALDYSPITGQFTWLKETKNGNVVRRRVGDIAGSIDKVSGYSTIRLDKKLYQAHRLAVFFMTGEWPEQDPDHRDNVRENNRWANLRPATRSQNAANGRVHRDNVTGLKGVTFRKD